MFPYATLPLSHPERSEDGVLIGKIMTMTSWVIQKKIHTHKKSSPRRGRTKPYTYARVSMFRANMKKIVV